MFQLWVVVNMEINLRVLQGAGDVLTSFVATSFWRRTLLHGVAVLLKMVL